MSRARTRAVVAAGTHAPAAWAWLRLALGFAQMGGAVLTATFLATLGSVDPWTIGAALGTTALTAASLALFPRGAR